MTTLTLYRLIRSCFDFYSWLILGYCILSWFPIKQNSLMGDIASAIATLVDPYLGVFRRFMPPMMGVDWSPVLAIVVLNLLERLVLSLVL